MFNFFFIISTAQNQLNIVLEAMRLIEDQTRNYGRDCIKFVPRTNEANYIQIQSLGGCYSNVMNFLSF